MNYIGIDISKDDFYAGLDNNKSLSFANNIIGINAFKEHLEYKLNLNKSETKIWVESTGIYHVLFCDLLTSEWWNIYVINPILTHKQITSDIRCVKNDKSDSFAIRNTLMSWVWYLYTDTHEILKMKSFVKERMALVSIKSTLKQRLHVHSKKQEILWDKFKSSFTKVVSSIEKEIDKINKQLTNIESEKQKLLCSIPWIWIAVSTSLIAEIWDINRFSNSRKLVAYLWMDCRVYKSWTSVNWKWFITKKWNSYLRWLLFNASLTARKYNKDLEKYYDKKISEWKHYFSAMCAVERKLIELIYSVWKRWTPFVKR